MRCAFRWAGWRRTTGDRVQETDRPCSRRRGLPEGSPGSSYSASLPREAASQARASHRRMRARFDRERAAADTWRLADVVERRHLWRPLGRRGLWCDRTGIWCGGIGLWCSWIGLWCRFGAVGVRCGGAGAWCGGAGVCDRCSSTIVAERTSALHQTVTMSKGRVRCRRSRLAQPTAAGTTASAMSGGGLSKRQGRRGDLI